MGWNESPTASPPAENQPHERNWVSSGSIRATGSCNIPLKRRGWKVRRKRVHRICVEENLAVCRRRRSRRRCAHCAPCLHSQPLE
jgi:hypothetical protein